MIYIVIKDSDKGQHNGWAKNNLDPAGGDNTFTPNKYKGTIFNKYCMISLPNRPDVFTEKMKGKFGWTDTMPDGYSDL